MFDNINNYRLEKNEIIYSYPRKYKTINDMILEPLELTLCEYLHTTCFKKRNGFKNVYCSCNDNIMEVIINFDTEENAKNAIGIYD